MSVLQNRREIDPSSTFVVWWAASNLKASVLAHKTETAIKSRKTFLWISGSQKEERSHRCTLLHLH